MRISHQECHPACCRWDKKRRCARHEARRSRKAAMDPRRRIVIVGKKHAPFTCLIASRHLDCEVCYDGAHGNAVGRKVKGSERATEKAIALVFLYFPAWVRTATDKVRGAELECVRVSRRTFGRLGIGLRLKRRKDVYDRRQHSIYKKTIRYTPLCSWSCSCKRAAKPAFTCTKCRVCGSCTSPKFTDEQLTSHLSITYVLHMCCASQPVSVASYSAQARFMRAQDLRAHVLCSSSKATPPVLLELLGQQREAGILLYHRRKI